MTEIMFVYGTLKRGWRNNRLLQNDRARFIGRAQSKFPAFVMQTGGFPILWEDEGCDEACYVLGELYEASSEVVRACDQLEDHPRVYCREKRMFKLVGRGDEIEAWVYLWQHERDWRPVEAKAGVYDWQGGHRD